MCLQIFVIFVTVLRSLKIYKKKQILTLGFRWQFTKLWWGFYGFTDRFWIHYYTIFLVDGVLFYTFRNYVHLYNILLPLKRVQRNEIQYDHYFILVVIIGVYHIKLLDLEIYL